MRASWISANDRTHWAVKARQTKQWRRLAYITALANQLPTGLNRVHVVATVHKTTNRQYDVANLYPTIKAAIDGIVTDYGLTPDDDNKHLIGPDMRAGEARDKPQIVLTITEVQ
jgi:crossover junction endodeoxyribonuclease RusA